MKLPDPIFPYKQSILPLFPQIVRTLNHAPRSPSDLFEYLQSDNPDLLVQDFIDALDCLFVLGRVNITEEREVLVCAD